MFDGKDGGEARLKEVAGLDPKLVWVFVWLMFVVRGLAGVCGFDPDGGVRGGWNRRPDSRCCAGDCGPRWWLRKLGPPSMSIGTGDGGLSSSD